MTETLVFCASVFVNVVVALTVLLRPAAVLRRSGDGPPMPRLGLERVLASAGAVLVATAVEAALLWRPVLNAFGVLQLLWLDLVVVAPITGVLLLATHGREHLASRTARIAAWLALALVPLGIYAQWVEPFDVRLEQATVLVDAARAGDRPLRVGILSDVQTDRVGRHERDAVDRLAAQRPDLVLVAGDLFEGSWAALRASRADFGTLLGRLAAPGGVWVVPGDPVEAERLPELLEGTGARLLLDQTVTLEIGDRSVSLLGLRPRTEPSSLVRSFEALPGDDDLRIVLSHMPRAALDLPPDSRVDLVVAGHTHGGQVALPGLGPVVVASPVPAEVAAGGLHRVEGNALYVSRGVGLERDQAPRIRFLCPPEVAVVTLVDR